MSEGFVKEVTAAKQSGEPAAFFTNAEVVQLRGARIVEWYKVDVPTKDPTLYSAPIHMFPNGRLGIVIDEIEARGER